MKDARCKDGVKQNKKSRVTNKRVIEKATSNSDRCNIYQMLNVMDTKRGYLRPVHKYVQYMVHSMMCKEGKTSKLLAAAGIAYVVVCDEV